jgi:hypothetical protein
MGPQTLESQEQHRPDYGVNAKCGADRPNIDPAGLEETGCFAARMHGCWHVLRVQTPALGWVQVLEGNVQAVRGLL